MSAKRNWKALEDYFIKVLADLPHVLHKDRPLLELRGNAAGEVDESDANMYFPEDEADGFVLLCRARRRVTRGSARIKNGSRLARFAAPNS